MAWTRRKDDKVLGEGGGEVGGKKVEGDDALKKCRVTQNVIVRRVTAPHCGRGRGGGTLSDARSRKEGVSE